MEMTFTPIDLRSWSRGEVFYYFSQMEPTGYSLTAELDITQMHRLLKSEKRKFFPAYLWLVIRMLNAQMEFKMAEVDGKLGYYNVLTPLYAAFHEDSHTFSLMWTSYDDSFAAFYESYQADQAQYGQCHRLLAKERPASSTKFLYRILCAMDFVSAFCCSFLRKKGLLFSVSRSGEIL